MAIKTKITSNGYKRKYRSGKDHPNYRKSTFANLTKEQKEKYMEKMKDNKYWKLAINPGRPKLFTNPNEIIEALDEYEYWCKENPLTKEDFIKSGEMAGQIVKINLTRTPNITGFCAYLGISNQTLLNYENLPENRDFFEAIAYVRAKLTGHLGDNSLAGVANPMIAARMLGLKEKQDITTNDKDLTIGKIEFIADNEQDKRKVDGLKGVL